MKILVSIILTFFLLHGFGQDKNPSPPYFKEARVIFAGKIKGYETKICPGEELLIAEFQMIAILKGEARYNLLAIMDKADTLNFEKEYLVYAVKNKDRDANGKRIGYIYYTIFRIVELEEDRENDELSEMVNYVRKKFFRSIKKPISESRLNCHCGI
ncbi:MAG: hypothetical protein JXR58_00490 [Bacteroidales bacterium]|nr:hypothetical protein [Bacteroidales bacterium]